MNKNIQTLSLIFNLYFLHKHVDLYNNEQNMFVFCFCGDKGVSGGANRICVCVCA